MRSKSLAAPARKTAGGTSKAAAARTKTSKIGSAKKVTVRPARRKVTPAMNGKPVSKSRSKGSTAAGREKAVDDFRRVVNIAAAQLERWLETPESKKLGRMDESSDKDPGRMVLKILKKARDNYRPEDFDHMRRVTGEIGLRLSKRPKGDIIASNWRYSLMNWGHDPSKPFKRTRVKQNGK